MRSPPDQPLLSRLAGLETEYAIRFTAADDGERPGHEVVYDAVARAIGGLVRTRPGARRFLSRQIFTQNGGAFYYDAVPAAPSGGVVEGGTPECRGPSQLMLYQRAQDTLLERALPVAARLLARRGFEGTLGLLKNCRDAEGHVYGAQENYEAPIADGAGLWAYRISLALLLPLVVVPGVLTWLGVIAIIAVLLALMPVGLAIALVGGVVGFVLPPVARALDRVGDVLGGERGENAVSAIFQALQTALWWPVMKPYLLILRAFAFRPHRRGAEAFLVSRSILSGAGTLDPDGSFQLSEKATAMSRILRATPWPGERAVFDPFNLLKHVYSVAALRLGAVRGVFARRQRLQLGLADSNCAQIAEYLRLGTTMLVLDMAEAGWLDDAPRLSAPIGALHVFNGDPALVETVTDRAGRDWTALGIQRFYQQRAARFVAEASATSIEAVEVVRVWGTTLDALARDPAELVGALDWVTKRWLLDQTADGADAAVRKKVDLRYHELGTGYFARIERAGGAVQLVAASDVEDAITLPPRDSPAHARGRLVRRLADAGRDAIVSWEQVRVSGRGGTVIKLFGDDAPDFSTDPGPDD